MDYIQVENGQVKGYPTTLPQNWKDVSNYVSNFYVLDDVSLRQYGWYPVRVVRSETTENKVVTGQLFVVEETEVVQYEQVRDKTTDELEQELTQKWINIRVERNTLLTESDWTQLSDSPIFGTPLQEEWKEYRQALRDITNYPSPDVVIWPQKPEYTSLLPTEEPIVTE